MTHTILTLNYVAVVVTALIGFMLGWLWYSPVLFAKPWMAEMKFTEETMKAAMAKGVAKLFAMGIGCTLLSTFGLAVLITAAGTPNWKHGAAYGMFLGAFVVGARMINGSCWEQKSVKLQVITIGHEVALYTLQGAILGAWH